ncbi:helix-turn-helix transcriptional regulator [Alkaliphilus sp. B6464]
MSLGKKLLYLRKQAGLSQEDVAEKLGVSRQTVSKWETDQTSLVLK